MTYRVSYQDFRGWREAEPDEVPEVLTEDFEERGAAEAFKNVLASNGLTACVTQLPPPLAKVKHQDRTPIDTDGSRFNEKWKLAR